MHICIYICRYMYLSLPLSLYFCIIHICIYLYMSPAVVPGELGRAACFREREWESQIVRVPLASLFFFEFWLGGMQVLSGNDAGEKKHTKAIQKKVIAKRTQMLCRCPNIHLQYESRNVVFAQTGKKTHALQYHMWFRSLAGSPTAV